MKKGRIIVVPLSQNLLLTLAENVLKEEKPEKSLLIFPHRRATVFTKYYMFRLSKRELILPKMIALQDWVIETYLEKNTPIALATEMEQAWLAYLAYRQVTGSDEEWERFFKWAFRMVKLFREFDMELVENIKNIVYPGDELREKVERILSRIGDIYERFNKLLKENHLTTYSRILKELAHQDLNLGENIHLAGFFALTRAESRLFKNLYNNGATFWWHTDPENLPDLYKRWLNEWNLKEKDLKISGESKEVELENIQFVEATTLHSEIEKIKKELGKPPVEPDEKAIVLLDQTSLLPVVLSLPENIEVNVTLGYPLFLTGLYSLFESIFKVLTSEKDEKYRFSEVVELLRIPYLEHFAPMRERLLESTPFFIDKKELGDLYNDILKPFENANSPFRFSGAIIKILQWLLDKGNLKEFEKNFVLKMIESVIPQFQSPLYKNAEMRLAALFSMLQWTMKKTSVPFEGEPLKGLQIMGLLETRLLSFRKLFVIDANDDVMPGSEEVNPLLPHELRNVLGLPERYRREEIIRYHFERLVFSSKEVFILWRNQITTGEAGLESKKIRSRFVERLLWEKEKKKGKILENEIERIFPEIHAKAILPEKLIKKTSEHKQALEKFLKSGISPSLLDSYIKCPLSFYYKYLLEIEDLEDVKEIHYDKLGSAMHKALERYYKEISGTQFPKEVFKKDLNANRIHELLLEEVKREEFYQHLSEARKFLLSETAKYRIKRFVDNQPDRTTIVALEKELKNQIKLKDKTFTIKGFADRIDLREEIYIVIDYKTGFSPNLEFNKIVSLLEKLRNEDLGQEFINLFYQILPSIQLPLYAYMYSKEVNKPVLSAYIELNKKSEEKIIPSTKTSSIESYHQWLTKYFPEILKLLIKHILESAEWYPASDGSNCSYCVYRKMCRYAL